MPLNTPQGGPPSARWPDFFLIGAMKSGSTTLAARLDACDGLMICKPKEPQYFSGGRFGKSGVDSYCRLFASAPPTCLCGDASTCYSRYPHHGDVADQIARQCPNARFIYLMRDPADRIYSHYLHSMQTRWHAAGLAPLTFEEAWRGDSEYLDASRYLFQLKQYLRHFPRDRFFLCTTEELRDSPQELVERICAFLRADSIGSDRIQDERKNASLGENFRVIAARRTTAKIRHSVVGRALAPCIPTRLRRSLGKWIRSAFADTVATRDLEKFQAQLSPYRDRDRIELLAELRSSILDLQDFWGRDLSDWLEPRRTVSPATSPARPHGR